MHCEIFLFSEFLKFNFPKSYQRISISCLVGNFLNKIKIVDIANEQIFVFFWTAAELQVAVIIWKKKSKKINKHE